MSTFIEAASEITDLQTELDRMKEEMLKKARKSFDGLMKKFFKECPRIKAIAWTQYTPYFNDGDTCEFSVSEVYYLTCKVDGTASPYDYEDGEYSTYITGDRESLKENLNRYQQYVKEYSADPKKDAHNMKDYYQNRFDEIQRQLDSGIDYGANIEAAEKIFHNEDLMLDLFGDHVAVHLFPGGKSEVSEFEHD